MSVLLLLRVIIAYSSLSPNIISPRVSFIFWKVRLFSLSFISHINSPDLRNDAYANFNAIVILRSLMLKLCRALFSSKAISLSSISIVIGAA